MQLDQKSTSRSQPRVFNYSLDWRFLLPLSNHEKILVLFEKDPDLCQTLEYVGIPASNQLSFLDIEQRPRNEANSLVLPFGLSVQWVSGEPVDQIEFFRSIHKLISDHGNLLLGFNNSRVYRSNIAKKYYSSTPQRMTAQLQRAGFKAITVFGVIPNLKIPEYIFDLNSHAADFALQHRFKRKRVLSNLLQLLSYPAGGIRLSDFLPGYFVAATV